MQFLSPEALIGLTGRKYRQAQRHVLDAMAIPYLTRPDGSLVVEESAIAKVLRLESPPTIEPDFEAITRNAKTKKAA